MLETVSLAEENAAQVINLRRPERRAEAMQGTGRTKKQATRHQDGGHTTERYKDGRSLDEGKKKGFREGTGLVRGMTRFSFYK